MQKSIAKMEILTPCKIVTLQSFNLKFDIRDYVGDITSRAVEQ